jgi:hypothetical protein
MTLKLYIIFLSILIILNATTQNYKFVDPIENYNFCIESIPHLTPYKKDTIFERDKRLYAIITILKLYIIFLSILMTSNEKTKN